MNHLLSAWRKLKNTVKLMRRVMRYWSVRIKNQNSSYLHFRTVLFIQLMISELLKIVTIPFFSHTIGDHDLSNKDSHKMP